MVSWRRKWAAGLFAAPCQASVKAGGLCDCLGAVSQVSSRKETDSHEAAVCLIGAAADPATNRFGCYFGFRRPVTLQFLSNGSESVSRLGHHRNSGDWFAAITRGKVWVDNGRCLHQQPAREALYSRFDCVCGCPARVDVLFLLCKRWCSADCTGTLSVSAFRYHDVYWCRLDL